MKPTGTYKLRYRGEPLPARATLPSFSEDSVEALLTRVTLGERRLRLILDSLRSEILEEGDGANLRIRRVFSAPREIFRLELARPELGYQRTTLLDRDALESLLEADDVRAVVETANLGA